MNGKARKISLSVATTCVFLISGCDRVKSVVSKPHPKIVIQSRLEEIGATKSDANRLTFIFSNKGNAELQLGPPSTSCGCSSVKLSKKVVPPGETSTLSVEGVPPATASRQVSISLTTNDPTQPQLSFPWELVGRPDPPELMTSHPSINLGIIRPKLLPIKSKSIFDVLEVRGTEPILRKAEVRDKGYQVEGGMIDEVIAANPKLVVRTYRYDLSMIEIPDTVGNIASEIRLYTHPDAVAPWLTLPITGVVPPPVRSMPSSIPLSWPDDGGKTTFKVIVIADDQSNPIVAECVGFDPRLTVRILQKEVDRVLFAFEMDSSNRGLPIAPLRFRVDQPIAASLEVPIYPTNPAHKDKQP